VKPPIFTVNRPPAVAPSAVAKSLPRRVRPISPLNTHADQSRTALGVENLSWWARRPGPLAAAVAANCLVASQPVKSSRRQSAMQIISTPVSPSNHLGASQPPKSSQAGQSASQIISTPVSPSNYLGASQPPKSSQAGQSASQIISTPVSPSNHLGASQPPKSSQAGQSVAQMMTAHGRRGE
jgi:hypothetical protein